MGFAICFTFYRGIFSFSILVGLEIRIKFFHYFNSLDGNKPIFSILIFLLSVCFQIFVSNMSKSAATSVPAASKKPKHNSGEKENDFSHIDVNKDATWLIKNPKDLKDKWTDEELLYVKLNQYVHVQLLQSMRTAYATQFPGFDEMWNKLMWVYFDKAGLTCATNELKNRILYKFCFYRKQLESMDEKFIVETVVPTLFKEVNVVELWKFINEEFPDDVESVWDHMKNIFILLKKIVKFNPERAFQGVKAMTEKDRSKMLALPENKDLLELYMGQARQNSAVVSAAKKKLQDLPPQQTTTTSVATAANPNKNPISSTPSELKQPQQQQKPNTIKIRPPPHKKHGNNEEEDEDDEDDYDSEEDAEQAKLDAEEMQKTFQKTVGDLLGGDAISDLMAMGQEQENLAKERELSAEEVKVHAAKQEQKFQGILGKLAGGLDSLISNVGGKKEGQPQISAIEREKRRKRFEHVLSRVTRVQMPIHQDPELLLRDAEAEQLEKQALEDEEQRKRTDIQAHFNEELRDFLYFIYKSRGVEGMQEFVKALPGSKEKRDYKSWETTFLALEAAFSEMDENELTDTYLSELIKVHDDKELRKAYRNKQTFGDLFLGVCRQNDPVATFTWKTTDPENKLNKITITYTNKYFLRLWQVSPAMAKLFYRIKINKIYKSYFKFPKNLKVVKSRLANVMQFVAILSNFKPGTSMEAMRPILMSVLATNKVTPDKQNDTKHITDVLENVVANFSTDMVVENMEKTCGDIMASGDVERPMAMFTQMFKPELAENLGLNMDDDDDDDEEEEKQGGQNDKKDKDLSVPINMKKLDKIGSILFKSTKKDEKGETVKQEENPWHNFMKMMQQQQGNKTPNEATAQTVTPSTSSTAVTNANTTSAASSSPGASSNGSNPPKKMVKPTPAPYVGPIKKKKKPVLAKTKPTETEDENEPVATVKVKAVKSIMNKKKIVKSEPMKPLKTIVIRKKKD
jgi:hypothetical protein